MQTRARIKICGITRAEDAVAAGRLGADAIGLNFYPGSKRYVTRAAARAIVAATPPLMEIVAVFVGCEAAEIHATLVDTGIGTAQLHHQEPPEMVGALAPWRVIRAFGWEGPETAGHIDDYLKSCEKIGHLPAGVLLDTYKAGVAGGTGETWHWSELSGWRPKVPMILAGGLNPENVGQAVEQIRPAGVDVAGGVESSPGVKDVAKMAEFIRAVRQADGAGNPGAMGTSSSVLGTPTSSSAPGEVS